MSLNFVSMGIFFNWISNLILAAVVMGSNYEISSLTFTFFLLISLFFWSGVVGKLSSKYGLSAKVNGFYVGLGSVGILFLALFLTALPSFNTIVYFTALWMVVGFGGGWFGSLFNIKKRKHQKA